MSKKNSLYKLTPGEIEIFDTFKRERNINRFTNFYFRNEDSGTYWRFISDDKLAQLSMPQSIDRATKWKQGYEALWLIWDSLNQPEFFGLSLENAGEYVSLNEDEFVASREKLQRVYKSTWLDEENPQFPVFHHPHGALLLPWQHSMLLSKHSLQVVPGGYGSGKTWGKMLGMGVNAATLKGYRGLALAPYAAQAEEVHKQMLAAIEGTLFAERFLIAAPTKPRPQLIIGNDIVGRNTIECFSILDGSSKLLTLTADEALVDQAELIDGTGGQDLETVVRNISSRFRGQVRGRPRLGIISLVANSADNPQLWDFFDEAETDPDFTWAYSPTTHENTYLTVDDLIRYERRVGKDDDQRRMYILGGRPIGSGEHFSAETITKCRSKALDEIVTEAIKKKLPGFKRIEKPRVSVCEFEIPYEEGEEYIVAADPGWGNPPYRNAPAIGVFKITGFPKVPASLVNFQWVFGNNSPNPWMAKFTDLVIRYHAIGKNGFDATGFQSGYERMTDIGILMPTPIQLSGQKKFVYLNFTKKLMANGQFQIPASITHAFSQFAKYKIPDDNLRQDIVMMFLVASGLLEPYFYEDELPDEIMDFDPEDREWRDVYDRDGAFFER